MAEAETNPDKWYAKLFQKIGPEMGAEFEKIGTNLGFTNAELDNIRDSSRHAKNWGFKLLTEWKQKLTKEQNPVALLKEALTEANRGDLATIVEQEDDKRNHTPLHLPSPPTDDPRDEPDNQNNDYYT
ncbi:unnamed protein product [Owenia fusiformis]|uniref:Uncharacterized protein n=1 Tax=Owenia fusiformis TaxID=6347 RepID=A0A8J1XKW9_OWEFU|nr:unnamed protein product [Owenia fusiformis]